MKIYILFQSDNWETRSSKVCFGAFSTKSKAIDAAEKEDLHTHETTVIIDEVELDEFDEI